MDMLRAQPPQTLPVCKCKRSRYASVYWDLLTCPYGSEKDLHDIIRNIRTVLDKVFKCDTYFTAFGDCFNKHRNICSEMRCILTTNESPENDAGKIICMMEDWRWADQAPSYVLVMSGNKSLLPHLEELRRQNYTIIVARPDVAETTLYEWNSTILFEGELPDLEQLEMCLAQLPQAHVACKYRYASVYWDLHTCPYGSEKDFHDIMRNMRTVLAKEFKCNTYFTAFGDCMNKHRNICSEISCIWTTNKFPERDAGKIICMMKKCRRGNHTPSYFLVISGNEHLSSSLDELRRQHYNIIPAHPNVAASTHDLWNSRSLFCGEVRRIGGLKRKAGVREEGKNRLNHAVM